MYTKLPRVYGCERNGNQLSCIPIRKISHEALIQYCKSNPDARLLVRYPRGQHRSDVWKERVSTVMEIVLSESFKVSKRQMWDLLPEFYKFSSQLQGRTKLKGKLNDVWDDKGKITIYIVKVRAGPHKEQLKAAKKYIRAGFDTMHVLHTSDDQYETVYFAEHIYNDAFLESDGA